MKDIISTQVGDLRYVSAGRSLHVGKDWKVFPDFLSAYLGGCLNPKWGEAQLARPFDEQHPVNQWYSVLAASQATSARTPDGLMTCNTGGAQSWFRLAYDLYLIEHNASLQRRLIRRLRDPKLFQGARFEITAAAILLAAGYELEFAPEKGDGKHPEFFATGKHDGRRIAVEAKSRHRPGILGFRADEAPDHSASLDISGLLERAADKDTEDPLLIFIELNVATMLTPATYLASYQELNAAWDAVQNRTWAHGFPAVGVVFYNDVSPWFLDSPLQANATSIWATALWPHTSRHDFPSRELIATIVDGCANRTEIPHAFPRS